jgi:SAM-dependent methyltransferase
MKYFVDKHMPQNSIVLDFGGADVNGTYKDIITEHDSTYITLDWDNADYIVKGYDWKDVPKKHFDVVITGQAFEHDSYFWKSLENIKNACKDNGLVIIIVPSKGNYHTHPIDCYRFYPDSAKVFAEILNADILEIVWNSDKSWKKFNKQDDTDWGDLGMVFKLKKI